MNCGRRSQLAAAILGILLCAFLQAPAAGQGVEEDEEQKYLEDVLREEEERSTKAAPSEKGKDSQSDAFDDSPAEEQGQGKGGAAISPADQGKVQVQEDLLGDDGNGLTKAEKHQASVYVDAALDRKLDQIEGKVAGEEAKHYLVYTPSPEARENPAIKDYERKLWQEKVRDYNSAQLHDQLLTELDLDIDPESLPDRLPANGAKPGPGGAEKGSEGAAAAGAAQTPSTLNAGTAEVQGSGQVGSSTGAQPGGAQEPAAQSAPSSKFMEFLAQAGIVSAEGDSQGSGGATSAEMQESPKAADAGAGGAGAERAQELAQGSTGAEAAPSGEAAAAASGQAKKDDFPSLPIPRPMKAPSSGGAAETETAAQETASLGSSDAAGSQGETPPVPPAKTAEDGSPEDGKTGDGAAPEDPKGPASKSGTAGDGARTLGSAGSGAASNFAENFSLDREISALNATEGEKSESGGTDATDASAGNPDDAAGSSDAGADFPKSAAATQSEVPQENILRDPGAAEPALEDQQAQRSAETAAVLKWERNLQDPELAAADPLTPEEVAAIERRRARLAQDPEGAARLGQRIGAREQLIEELEKDTQEFQEELADNRDWARILLFGRPMAEAARSDTEDSQDEAQASQVSIQTRELDRLRRENQFYAELRLEALRWQLLHDRADIFLWECAEASCNLPGQEVSAQPVEEPAPSLQ